MAEPTEDAVPEEWAYTAKLPSEGDTDAARAILREFVEAVALVREKDWPSQLPLPVTRYIAGKYRSHWYR